MAKILKLGNDLKNVIIDLIKIAIPNELKTTILNLLDNNDYSKKYNLVTGASPIKTGRKIDGRDEYVKRYYTSTASLTQTNSVEISSGLILSKINVIKIEGVIKSNSDNIFSINAPNHNGGYVYCFFRASDNKIVITCSTGNYQRGAYIDVYHTYK